MPVAALTQIAGPFLSTLATLALALGLLWWLQSVLVPVALAILLTFLLSPPVSWLQRRGLPRPVAVVAMLVGSIAIGGSIAWTVALQVNRLVDTFPEYQAHLDAKIAAMQSGGNGFFDKVQAIVARVSTQLDKVPEADPHRPAPADPTRAPQPVIVVNDAGPFHITAVWQAIRPLLEPLATGGLTLVLVIFMLLRREDLRDRVIAVVGHGRLVATTKAFDDAGKRISRYLVRQLMVNCGFGLTLGLGLFAIGVPYAILWGALAALLRYVPYLGTWVAASVPVALSLVITDGWGPLVMVGILFLVLELVTNMFVEPRFYGQGVGVSETGTLVMIAFWTWLWGPVGLLLATPLTVCVVVLGKYVAPFRSFSLLLGDRQALAADVRFYQRLLAHDEHEAMLIARQSTEAHSLPVACDELVRPALGYLRRDADKGQLNQQDERAALEVCERVADRLVAEQPPAADALAPLQPMLIVPARGAASATAGGIVARLLAREGLVAEPAAGGLLAPEIGESARRAGASAALVSAVDAPSLAHLRLMCLRLRAARPEIAIVLGLWGQNDPEDAERWTAAGIDHVVHGFDEARLHLLSIAVARPPVAEPAPAPVFDALAGALSI